MRELHAISRDCADEFERETGIVWNKGTYLQHLHEAPPMRLLVLAMAASAWIAWVMHQKHGDAGTLSSSDCLRLLSEALNQGAQFSKNGVVP